MAGRVSSENVSIILMMMSQLVSFSTTFGGFVDTLLAFTLIQLMFCQPVLSFPPNIRMILNIR